MAVGGGSRRFGAAPWVPRDRSWQSLRTAAQECQGCELYEGATQAVLGAGAEDAALMLVGEQPGDQEDRKGLPFVGPAGQLLVKALDAAEIDPATIYRTNAVKHFRFTGTSGKRRIHRAPDLSHMRACAPWLEAELELVDPTGVVLLGATAGKAIYGSGFRVGEVRGVVRDWPEEAPGNALWSIATIHPSAILRAESRDEPFADLVNDLVTARKTLAASPF